MSVSNFRGAVEWALMVGLVFGAGAIAQAQQEEEQPDGRVVQIGRADQGAEIPDGRANQQLDQPTDGAIVQEAPKFWIGLRGTVIGDDDPLRAHVDVPAKQGLLVYEIVPDGPADKAGLKKFDILVRGNDQPLREMNDLIELVGTEGEKQGQIALDVIRHGASETVFITPAERPADAMVSQPGGGQDPFTRGMGVPQGWERFMQRDGQPFDFRNFGPGVIMGGPGFANIPNGVSVSIQKEDGKPARVTVKRGDESWEVVGDDPESLKQLPEDLRPFVEQMVEGGAPWGTNFQMPNIELPNFEGFRGGRFEDGRLRDRLDQMERRMNELFERFNDDRQPNDQPQAEQEEAK
jgi:hypothetical protein